MGYRIYSKYDYQTRHEWFDRKTYSTREKAEKALKGYRAKFKAIDRKYKGSYEIRSDGISTRRETRARDPFKDMFRAPF